MADSRPQTSRSSHNYFCHRCAVEFSNIAQEYTCPFCSSGFIEQLEQEGGHESSSNQDDVDFNDADSSYMEEAGNSVPDSFGGTWRQGHRGHHMLARYQPATGQSDALMEHLVWMIGAGRNNAANAVNNAAGAPYVLVGAPSDYVFENEAGLDAVVTQLLGQLENAGPPPLTRDQIDAIPETQFSAAQTDSISTCCVCWDNFSLGEKVSLLECGHIFHPACITPWLQLHATCPICRRALFAQDEEDDDDGNDFAIEPAEEEGAAAASPPLVVATSSDSMQSEARGVQRRLEQGASGSSSSSAGYARGSSAGESSGSSLASDRDLLYMDIDYD